VLKNKFFAGIVKVSDETRRIRIQDPDTGSGSISQRQGFADPDPDPPQNVMDPQHCWIRTRADRIGSPSSVKAPREKICFPRHMAGKSQLGKKSSNQLNVPQRVRDCLIESSRYLFYLNFIIQ
jgi:hypothetical protein